MSVIVVFGLPGAGKTFVGKILKDKFGYFFYDGDEDLPSDMRSAIESEEVVSDAMRDTFFANIIFSLKRLKKKYTHVAIAQTFIKEKYRVLVRNNIPDAKFILVETNTATRETRLTKRKKYPIDLVYARKMAEIFEKPAINHDVVDNTTAGKLHVIKQLKEML